MTIAGGNKASYQQVVEQNQTDTVVCPLLVNGVALTADSATVTFYDPDGTALTAALVCTIAGNEASYANAFVEATYEILPGYKAVFAFTKSGSVYSRTVFFAVVRRRFRSGLDDAQLIAMHPGLTGLATSFEPWRTHAWDEIERILWAKFRAYPGNAFHPERFIDAHMWGTIERFYFGNAFSGNTTEEDAYKYEQAYKRFQSAVEQASAYVDFDADDDGVLDASEQGWVVSGIQLQR